MFCLLIHRRVLWLTLLHPRIYGYIVFQRHTRLVSIREGSTATRGVIGDGDRSFFKSRCLFPSDKGAAAVLQLPHSTYSTVGPRDVLCVNFKSTSLVESRWFCIPAAHVRIQPFLKKGGPRHSPPFDLKSEAAVLLAGGCPRRARLISLVRHKRVSCYCSSLFSLIFS